VVQVAEPAIVGIEVSAPGSRDTKREQAMAGLGFRTLRFWDNDVLNETDGVLERIRQLAETLTPTLSR
jgi:very-short-patch-repair endonuclease